MCNVCVPNIAIITRGKYTGDTKLKSNCTVSICYYNQFVTFYKVLCILNYTFQLMGSPVNNRDSSWATGNVNQSLLCH